MKALLILFSALVLAAPAQAAAESFSQLSDSGGRYEQASAPEPSAAQAVQDPSSPAAGVDYLVRPDAQHEPGAELFSPWRMSEK